MGSGHNTQLPSTLPTPNPTSLRCLTPLLIILHSLSSQIPTPLLIHGFHFYTYPLRTLHHCLHSSFFHLLRQYLGSPSLSSHGSLSLSLSLYFWFSSHWFCSYYWSQFWYLPLIDYVNYMQVIFAKQWGVAKANARFPRIIISISRIMNANAILVGSSCFPPIPTLLISSSSPASSLTVSPFSPFFF